MSGIASIRPLEIGLAGSAEWWRRPIVEIGTALAYAEVLVVAMASRGRFRHRRMLCLIRAVRGHMALVGGRKPRLRKDFPVHRPRRRHDILIA